MLNPDLLKHLFQFNHQQKGILDYKDASAGLWWKKNFDSTQLFSDKLDQLVCLSFQADNLSSVFNIAYQFALREMFGKHFSQLLDHKVLSCLCVSESGGNSPKVMFCHLNQNGLTGEKTFVTCAPQVDHLLVLFDDQRAQEHHDAKNLRIAFIENARQREGVTIVESEPAKFLPNIDKGKVIFENLRLDGVQVLSEDAHEFYSKPFSLLEGLYIRLACVAYLSKICLLLNAEKTLQADVLSELSILADLANANKQTPYYQLALDAHARRLMMIVGKVETLLETQSEAFKASWQRDKVIFFMDTPLRAKRLEQAWQRIQTHLH